jgi:iron(III) transport system permease protein
MAAESSLGVPGSSELPGGEARKVWARWRRDPWLLLSVALTGLMFFLVIFPQFWIFRASLMSADGQEFTLANYADFFTTLRFRRSLVNSLWVSVAVAVGAVLVATPLAYFLARYRLPAKNTILTLVTMATISPPFLGAYAWVLLLGRGGIITSTLREWGVPLPFQSIIGPGGIIWVGVWITYAVVFLLIYDAFTNLDPGLEEAAMSVGANPLATFFHISLPMVTPALLTGFYLSLMAAFTDFGTPMIIGGGFQMLPVTIYYEFLSEVATNPSLASAASVIMIAVSTGLLLLQRYLIARRSYAALGMRRREPQPLSRGRTVLLQLAVGIVLLISFTPHLVVLLTSFMTWRSGILKWQFTLDNYIQLFRRSLEPIFVSYFLSIVATALVIVAGAMAAYIVARKNYRVIAPALNALVMLPYIIPGTVLAIGLILAFNQRPLLLTGTWVILVMAYFIRRLPYVMKAIESGLYQIHPSLEEAAMSVGASSTRAFTDITARMLTPSIVSGGTIAFLMIITELSSTVMLYAVPWITMTVVIFTYALQPGSPFGVASAMTVVLMVSIYVPLYVIRRRYQAARTTL